MAEQFVGRAHASCRNRLDAFVATMWTKEDEMLLNTTRGDPRIRRLGKRSWYRWRFETLSLPRCVVGLCWSEMPLGSGFGMVRLCAKAGTINEIAKKVVLHLAPMGA